jgi:hypothetical protein
LVGTALHFFVGKYSPSGSKYTVTSPSSLTQVSEWPWCGGLKVWSGWPTAVE